MNKLEQYWYNYINSKTELDKQYWYELIYFYNK